MAEDDSAPFIGMPQGGSVPKKSRAIRWASVFVPLTLVVLLLAAGSFAISQAARPRPAPEAAPPTQAYLDFGRSFAGRLVNMSPQTFDADRSWIMAQSTGHFHDTYLRWRLDFLKTVVEDATLVADATAEEDGITVVGSATSAALKSIDVADGKAQVLVAAEGKATDDVGETTPQRYRFLLTVERTDGALKTSQVEVVR